MSPVIIVEGRSTLIFPAKRGSFMMRRQLGVDCRPTTVYLLLPSASFLPYDRSPIALVVVDDSW